LATARSYQLWVRLTCRLQSGHGAGREREVKARVIVGGAGSVPQVSSRTAAGSGNKQEIKEIAIQAFGDTRPLVAVIPS